MSAASHPPIRQIAVQKGNVNDQVVLVPKDSPITSATQLKGRKVGYVRATTSHYLLLKLLAEQGLSFADITPVALSQDAARRSNTAASTPGSPTACRPRPYAARSAPACSPPGSGGYRATTYSSPGRPR